MFPLRSGHEPLLGLLMLDFISYLAVWLIGQVRIGSVIWIYKTFQMFDHVFSKKFSKIRVDQYF